MPRTRSDSSGCLGCSVTLLAAAITLAVLAFAVGAGLKAGLGW